MKRNFLVLALALVVLGFTSCCSESNKCEKNCVAEEVSECVKGKAKHAAEMLTERLELTEEQAKKVECLMTEKINKELCAKKSFETQLQEVLGDEKFEQFKALLKDCHKMHPCPPCPPCPAMKGCPDAPRPRCEKADSCQRACDKQCPKAKGCDKQCPKQCPNK